MSETKEWARRLRELFGRRRVDEDFYEQLEEILLEGDLGPSLSEEVVGELRACGRGTRAEDLEELSGRLKPILSAHLRAQPLLPRRGSLNLFLVLGVNGVGKTTTIAKMADYYRRTQGLRNMLLAAADTFRAAAIDQLALWGERLGLPVIRQEPGADPGAVIYDAISSGLARGAELILADTAGRMHTKAHLVKELAKIDKIIRARLEGPVYRKILVIDTTTGQNALRQAEVFQEAIGVDSVILAKYDSTAKGGVALAISKLLGLPFSFLGTGEKLGDLAGFDTDRFLDTLLAVP